MGDAGWRWPHLDHTTAAELLAEHVPVPDGGLVPCGEGDFCLAFRLGDSIVRVARHSEAARALRREACVLAEIAAALPLAVPAPVYRQPGSCPPFTTHREIRGEVLTREAWSALPAEPRRRLAGELASFLAALHALPLTIGAHCGVPRIERRRLARDLRRRAEESLHDHLSERLRQRLDRALAASAALTEEGWSPVILHCDIAPGHLLWDPADCRLTGVIDFGDLAVGEAARDFVFVYEDFGSALLDDVVTHYAGSGAAGFHTEIRHWYLLEAVSWTLETKRDGGADELRHGLAEIERELTTPPPDRKEERS